MKNFKNDENGDEVMMLPKQGSNTYKNNVYFYDTVSQETALELNMSLQKVADSILDNPYVKYQNIPKESRPYILLRVNSYGGDIYAGLSVVDVIQNLPVPVYTLVDGVAASAAAGIVMAGTKRFIQSHGYMLVHQLSSGCSGTHENFKDEILNQEDLMSTIKDFYLKYSKIKQEELDGILKHDLFLNATRCLELGLVDSLWDGKL